MCSGAATSGGNGQHTGPAPSLCSRSSLFRGSEFADLTALPPPQFFDLSTSTHRTSIVTASHTHGGESGFRLLGNAPPSVASLCYRQVSFRGLLGAALFASLCSLLVLSLLKWPRSIVPRCRLVRLPVDRCAAPGEGHVSPISFFHL